MFTESNISFSHVFEIGKGWSKTIHLPSDFTTISHWGSNKKDGDIFVCDRPDGSVKVLKGRFKEVSRIYGKSLTRTFNTSELCLKK